MTRVILQPCANAASLEHFELTVDVPVDFQGGGSLQGYQLEQLLRAHPDGQASFWGVQPGARSQQVKKWERIRPGDRVLFAGHGVVFADAIVTSTLRNAAFARSLWGSTRSDGGAEQTWELMFTLASVRPQALPITELNAAIGRLPNANVQEFVVLNEDASAALLELIEPGSTRKGHGFASLEELDLEARNVERYVAQHPEESAEVMRREAELVRDYALWLAERGHTAIRHRVILPEGGSIYTDLFDTGACELVEAKSDPSRHSVRTGLGQVLDYGRFISHSTKALLLPSPPVQDLVDLLHSQQIGVVWAQAAQFMRSDPDN